MVKKFFGVLLALMIFNVTVCFAAELVIFHTNDMHSRIQSVDDNKNSIGLSELAAAVKKVKSKNQKVK